GPVWFPLRSWRRARVTASARAAAVARAVLLVGTPGLQPGCRPMRTYSTESGTRPDFRARSTISGPMPAQSPSVIPMRGLFVLMLVLLIVIEPAQSSTSAIRSKKRGDEAEELFSINNSERFDVGL